MCLEKEVTRDMAVFVQQVINKPTLGSVYAQCLGLYFGVWDYQAFRNFAHGDIFMVGAFVGYYLILNFNIGLLPTVILTMVLIGVLGSF